MWGVGGSWAGTRWLLGHVMHAVWSLYRLHHCSCSFTRSPPGLEPPARTDNDAFLIRHWQWWLYGKFHWWSHANECKQGSNERAREERIMTWWRVPWGSVPFVLAGWRPRRQEKQAPTVVVVVNRSIPQVCRCGPKAAAAAATVMVEKK